MRFAVLTGACCVFALIPGLGLSDAIRSEPKDTKPKLAALPRTVPAPKDNPTTAEKVSLGKQLFFDPRLSGDNSMSCATCHLPGKAFADGLPTGKGHKGKRLARNTPGLLNVAFYKTYQWDGGADSLEKQALGPIQNPNEMNQSLGELVKELNAIPGYVKQFRRVFGARVTSNGIAKALAAFQRTLVTGRSPFDRYLGGDKKALSAAARRGLELFRGTAGCIRCHHGPMLTDNKFHRLGVALKDRGRAAISKRKTTCFGSALPRFATLPKPPPTCTTVRGRHCPTS